jgi:hypothetical protein
MISELPQDDNTAPGLHLLVNNGDLTVATAAVERLGFKDISSLFRFALAVFDQSATRAVTITDADGKRYTLTPTDKLLDSSPDTPNPQ